MEGRNWSEAASGLPMEDGGKDNAQGPEQDKEVDQAAQNGKPFETITPEGMYLNLSLALAHGSIVGVGSTHLEKIGLEVSAHRHSGNPNHQGRERAKVITITCKLRGTTTGGFQGGNGYCCKPT
jgi:hypothetical protein